MKMKMQNFVEGLAEFVKLKSRMDFLNWPIKEYKDDKTNLRKL